MAKANAIAAVPTTFHVAPIKVMARKVAAKQTIKAGSNQDAARSPFRRH